MVHHCIILTEDTTSAGVEWVAPNDNGSAILAYSIMYIPVGGTRNEIDAGGLSEILHGLPPGATYEIKVSACNAVGFGDWSPGVASETVDPSGTSGGNTIGGSKSGTSGGNTIGGSKSGTSGGNTIGGSNSGTSGGNIIGATNNEWCEVAAPGSDGTPGTPDPPTVSPPTAQIRSPCNGHPAGRRRVIDQHLRCPAHARRYQPHGKRTRVEHDRNGSGS